MRHVVLDSGALIALDRGLAVVLTSHPGDIARWGVPDGKIVRC